MYRIIDPTTYKRRQCNKTTRINLIDKLFISDIESFLSRIEKKDCWLFISKQTGAYARFRGLLAHRLSYELFTGAIPQDLTLDHLCGIKHCVNPEHLEPVSFSENATRYSAQKGTTYTT